MRTKIILVLMGFLNVAVFAGGTNFKSVNSSRVLSLGGLYIAGSNGLSGTINNPAGLIYLNGSGIELTIQDRLSTHEFNSISNGLYQSYDDDDINASGGAYWKVFENFIIGASYNNAVNYNVSWPFVTYRESDSASTVLGFEFANKINAEAISPAAAFKIGNYTIGLSVNLYRVTQHTAFPVANERWYQNVGDAAYQFTYDQDAWSYGFTLGFLADFSDKLSFGANVKSGFEAKLKGKAQSEMFAELDSLASQVNISGNFEVPWVFGLGIIYSLNENLKINLDGVYHLWSKTQKRFNYDFNNSFWQTHLSRTDSVSGINPSSFPLFFNNAFDIGFGLEYKSVGNFTYRIGYRFSQSPNSEITYSMLFPGVDHHSFSIGIGYEGEQWNVDGALVYSVGISKAISSSLQSLNGKYNYNSVMPSITLHYKL